MNKYGGVADLKNCNKRVYNLWYQMLRRCYDKEQHKRGRGKAYTDCEVCEEWMSLSIFATDIQEIEGYEEWLNDKSYCLDKDTKTSGNKIYSKENCRFIPKSENVKDISNRNPLVYKKPVECSKAQYILQRDGETLRFESEKDACKFLGVNQCVVASCYRSKCKCKGYTVLKEADMRGEQNE